MEMEILPVSEGLVTFDIKWRATTAGPSPDNNQRVELFLLGCKKAQKGNPCKGCFNSVTWDIEKAEFSRNPIEVADFIAENAPNKYITIGGGEPTDQLHALIPLTKRLKEHGFHIMMYTWRDLFKSLNCNFEYVVPTYIQEGNYTYRFDLDIKELLENIDIVVDGPYIQEERLYMENCNDGLFGSIGSGNQRVINIKKANDTHKDIYKRKEYESYCIKDLNSIMLDNNNDLIYIKKEEI